MMNNDLITSLANVTLALSFIVALVFGIAQVRATSRERRENLTLETLRLFQSREFAEILYNYSVLEIPQTIEAFRAMPKEAQILQIQFSQQMESLGMLVYEDIIDIDLVDKTLGSFVSSTWRRCEKFFYESRKHANDPYLAEYFEWMAKHIEERMKNQPRKPFNE